MTLHILKMLAQLQPSFPLQDQLVDIINNAAISIQKQDKQHRQFALKAV